MPLTLQATLAAVLTTGGADTFITRRQQQAELTLEGFPGDRHFGFVSKADSRTPQYPRGTPMRNSRQVSLVSVEELEAIATALDIPSVMPEWLGANLLLAGVPRLTQLPPATRLVFPQGAVIVIHCENLACELPGRQVQAAYPNVPNLATAFPQAAKARRGLVGWVERAGVLREGDGVCVQLPEQVIFSA